MLDKIASDLKLVLDEFLPQAKLTKGSVLVLGFSTSEAAGGSIGHHSSIDVAKVVYDVMYPMLLEKGVYLAAQCCEHLNRAIIVEKDAVKLDKLYNEGYECAQKANIIEFIKAT